MSPDHVIVVSQILTQFHLLGLMVKHGCQSILKQMETTKRQNNKSFDMFKGQSNIANLYNMMLLLHAGIKKQLGRVLNDSSG